MENDPWMRKMKSSNNLLPFQKYNRVINLLLSDLQNSSESFEPQPSNSDEVLTKEVFDDEFFGKILSY